MSFCPACGAPMADPHGACEACLAASPLEGAPAEEAQADQEVGSLAAPPLDQPAPPRGPDLRAQRARLTTGLLMGGVVLAAGLLFGGPMSAVALAGLEVAPILLVGVLAHLGMGVTWARVLSWLGTATVVLVAALAIAGVAVSAYAPASAHEALLNPILAGLSIALGLTALVVTPVGTTLARRLGLDPDRPVHRQALFLCVGLTLLCLVPMISTGGRALLIDFIQSAQDLDLHESSLDLLLPLLWILPGGFLLVGYGINRDGRSARERLGLTWPGLAGLGRGAAVGLALVPCALLLSPLLEWATGQIGLPVGTSEEVEKLFDIQSLTLGSAVALALAAGIGEELAVRGVLQPRLGLILSNSFFAALHALQYTVDGVLLVFALGLAFGLLRRRTSTAVSMVAHATYDFALLALLLLGADL